MATLTQILTTSVTIPDLPNHYLRISNMPFSFDAGIPGKFIICQPNPSFGSLITTSYASVTIVLPLKGSGFEIKFLRLMLMRELK